MNKYVQVRLSKEILEPKNLIMSKLQIFSWQNLNVLVSDENERKFAGLARRKNVSTHFYSQ